MKHLLLLLLTYIWVSLPLCAQKYNSFEGKLVIQSGDTLKGFIRDRADIHDRVFFQAANQTDFQEYLPGQVQSFTYAGGYYYKTVLTPVDSIRQENKFLLCC